MTTNRPRAPLVRRRTTASASPDVKHRSTLEQLESFAKLALAAFSLAGIVGMLFGFGVAMRLDSFGVDIDQVLHNPTDYLVVAVYVAVELTVKLLQHDFAWSPPWIVAWIAIYSGIAFLLWSAIPATQQWQTWLVSATRRGSRLAASALPRWRQSIAGLAIAASGAFYLLIPQLLIVILFAFAIPSLIGYVAADEYLYKIAVAPTECAQLKNADKRRAKHQKAREANTEQAKTPTKTDDQKSGGTSDTIGAVCLKVTNRDGKSIFGRRVIATSESVVLFDPDTGAVHVVPTKEAVVSLVSELPTPIPPSATPSVSTPQEASRGDTPINENHE